MFPVGARLPRGRGHDAMRAEFGRRPPQPSSPAQRHRTHPPSAPRRRRPRLFSLAAPGMVGHEALSVE